MSKRPRQTKNGITILHRRYYEGKPERIAALEDMRAADDVARKILELRNSAGISQRQLAKLVGTTASVICRL
jgi:ribosome-binding protein aMBF1 (putative translation factor)